MGPEIARSQTDFLIWDLDGNRNSGPELRTALLLRGYGGVYDTLLTPYIRDLRNYCSIFICLGIFPDATWLGGYSVEVDSLEAYLLSGGNIYMEGGETWVIDPPTAIHPYFNITGLSNGFGDLDTILGQAGTFTQGMTFDYSGDNAFIDRIAPNAFSFAIFANDSPPYFNGVANDTGNYKTVGTSFEFGGLVDGVPPSTKPDLADTLMHFFGCFRSVFTWDVGVIAIIRPERWTPPNTSVDPEVTVFNFGDSTASFNVTCLIDGYTNTQPVSNLASGNTAQVIFSPWTPGNCGAVYDLTAYTQLGTDERRSNDTMSQAVDSWDDRWTLPSTCSISPPTIDGVIDTLTEWQGATKRDITDYIGQGGGPFPCGSVYLYVMNDDSTVYFAVDGLWDSGETENDALDFYFEDSHNHAWPASPDSSEGELQFFHHIPPSIATFNYRPVMSDDNPLAYPVGANGYSSYSSGRMQYELALPLGLTPHFTLNAAPGETLGMWLAASDQESLTVYAWWPSSSSGGNNPTELGDLILCSAGALRDVGVLRIDSPSDTVCASTDYQVCATVRNFGNTTETFNVTYVVDGDTGVEQVNNLDPGDSVSFCFDSLWTVPPADSTTYTLVVCTGLSGDTLPDNDCDTLSIFAYVCPYRDVAVFSLTSPPDTVCTDSSYPVCVRVRNNGAATESFNLRYIVNGDSADQQVTSLAPGETLQVCFDSLWTVPPADSTPYLLTICSSLPGDADPLNDCIFQPIFAITCDTVGVEERRDKTIPITYAIEHGSPNPFHRTIEIRYAVPTETPITLSVYDIVGNRVRTLVNGGKEAGYYRVVWDGRDERGEELASGVYFYRMTAGRNEFTRTRKLILFR